MMRFFALLTLLLLFLPAARACTTFRVRSDEHLLFGQNYDWDVDAGLVVVNKRGLAKISFNQAPSMTWTSKYGSVTFNQYGIEFPIGGMNEKGLVIATMWLNATKYEPQDERPGLNVLQWIQYHLDTSETVEDIATSDVRIAPYAPGIGLHYLVADATGDVAAIEVLRGKQIVHRGESLPVPVLTNNTYAESLEHLRQHNGFGGELPMPERRDSLSRFVRAAAGIEADRPGPAADKLSILEAAGDPVRTQWSIVYDLKHGRIVWRTKANPEIRRVSMSEFDFECGSPRKIIDIHLGAGYVSPTFMDLAPHVNLELVTTAFRNTPRANLDKTPEPVLKAVAGYPDTVHCPEDVNTAEWETSYGRIRDRKVIQALRLEGDSGKTPRQVDHWVYFPSQEKAQAYASWLKEQGFTVYPLADAESAEVAVQFHSITSATTDVILPLITRLEEHARSLSGRYDGWETPVIADQPPATAE